MFKNKEVNHLIVTEALIAFISILGFLLLNNCIYSMYKKEILNNNAYIINSIVENHPELENEIIKYVLNNDITYSERKEILNRYGLNDMQSLDYINGNKELKNKTMLVSISYIFTIFLVMIIVLSMFVKKFYKKINDLQHYTNEVLNNRYSMDIREYDEGDISNLKNDLYKMTIKLREQSEISIRDKKDLEETLSDISHQLKTPLTSMYVINELLYDQKLDNKSKKEFLTKNKNQLERIEWLVTSLLKISRLDSGSEELKLKETSIDQVISKALEPLKIPMELKNIMYTVNCPKDIKANIDLNWTSEALINIIKNAYEHTPNDGSINIDVTNNPIYVEIKIKDTGCGISEDDIGHVFERFYKGKSSSKESIGIGLNMAKKIICLEQGDILVESIINEGTTFYVRFYKNVV